MGSVAITLTSGTFAGGDPGIIQLNLTLPSLGVLSLGSGPAPTQLVRVEIPQPIVAIHVLPASLGNLSVTLGWPDMGSLSVYFRGGGSLAITLPSFAVPTLPGLLPGMHSLSGDLIQIAARLPVSVGSFGVSQNNLGRIHFHLPKVVGRAHVLSAVKGRISAALPPFYFHAHEKTGSVGRLALKLPFIYYDSVLLSQGIIRLDITLPVVIATATGDLESATITYRTIVMNADNFGVTEYGDLVLKGMVDVFGKTIALNRNQLIQVGHSLDNTAHIDASFQTGTLDFSNPYWMKPRDFWIQLRSGKKIRMTIKDNEVPANESTYLSENFVENLQKTRVKVGRGLYSEFFDIKIENIDGELVDITNIHAYTDQVKGRKR